MKIEKNGRAYWMNRFNKVFPIGTGIMLLAILDYIRNRNIESTSVYVVSGVLVLAYGLLCKKRAKEAEERNNKNK